jgi:hypothetical protein
VHLVQLARQVHQELRETRVPWDCQDLLVSQVYLVLLDQLDSLEQLDPMAWLELLESVACLVWQVILEQLEQPGQLDCRVQLATLVLQEWLDQLEVQVSPVRLVQRDSQDQLVLQETRV